MVCVMGSVIGSVGWYMVGTEDGALAVDNLLLCFTNADCHNDRS